MKALGIASLLLAAACAPASADTWPSTAQWHAAEGPAFEPGARPYFSELDLDRPQPRDNAHWAMHLDDERLYLLHAADRWQSPSLQLYARSIAGPQGLRAVRQPPEVSPTGIASPWEKNWLLQEQGSIGERLRWDASEPRAALIVLQQRNESGYNTVVGSDFALPLDDNGLRMRGVVLGSMTDDSLGARGASSFAPTRSGHQIRFAIEHRGPTFDASFAFEQSGRGFRNDFGQDLAAGIRRLQVDAGKVWHQFGPFESLRLYVLSTGARAVHDAINVHQATRLGAELQKGGLRLTTELRGAERVRPRPDAAAQRERAVRLVLTGEVASWLPWMRMTFDSGRLVDLAADTPCVAHRITAEAALRLSPQTALDVALQQAESPARYGERVVRLDVSHALTATMSLRVLHTQRAVARRAPVAYLERERTLSTALHLALLHGVVYGGVATARAHDAAPSDEVFLRLVRSF
jgi:hypothetical protein